MSGTQWSIGLLIAPSILFCLAAILFALRICTRYTSRSLSVDDLLLSSGMMSGLGLYIVCTISVLNGMGHNIEDLEPERVTLMACLQLFIAEFYVWTSTFVKLALAVMLYRVRAHNVLWRTGLFGMMVFIVALAVASCLWDYLQCRPIRALWDQSYSRDYCSLNAFRKWIYTASTLFLLTDVIFALLPIVFIRKIRRPLREKIVLYFLMALGITCAASIIPKLVVLQQFESRDNFTQTSARTMMWSQIEVYTGINAVCIPVLKNWGETVLRKAGLLSSDGFNSHGINSSKSGAIQYPKPAITRNVSYYEADAWDPVPEDWSWIGLTDPCAVGRKAFYTTE